MVLITPRLVRALNPDEVPPLPTSIRPLIKKWRHRSTARWRGRRRGCPRKGEPVSPASPERAMSQTRAASFITPRQRAGCRADPGGGGDARPARTLGVCLRLRSDVGRAVVRHRTPRMRAPCPALSRSPSTARPIRLLRARGRLRWLRQPGVEPGAQCHATRT